MSGVMEAREPSAEYLSTQPPSLVQHFELMATAPGGVAKLRELILTLAVQGKLVPQDPRDEPASELLQRIRLEKDRLVAEGQRRQDKPQAKVAVDEQPFELPRTWAWARFGDVAQVSSGVTLGRKTAIQKPVSLPYLRVANVQRWHVALDALKEVVIDGSELDRFQVRNGDLLITEGGDWDKVGRTAIWRDELPMCLHQNHVFKARGFNTEWNPLWAQLYLNSAVARSYFAASAKQTTNLASINMTELKACVFPVPPCAEQTRIVTRVEELMRLCDALETQGQLEAAQHAQLVQTLLGTLTTSATPEELADNWQRVATHFDLLLDRPEAVDALEQTILQLAVRGLLVPQDPNDEPASALLQKIRAEKERRVLSGDIKREKSGPPVGESEQPFDLPAGWRWERLVNLCNFIDYRGKTPTKTSSGVPLITAKNVRQGYVDREPREFIAESAYASWMTRGLPRAGDLLLTTEAPLGNVAAVHVEECFALAQRVICLSLYECSSSRALSIFLRSPWFQAALAAQATGVTAQGIKSARLQLMPIPVPPLAEQQRIATRTEQLLNLCADLRQRLVARQATQALLAEALIDEVD